MNYTFVQDNIWLFVLLAVWEVVWKGVALWRAAQQGKRNWFIALLMLNTAGILPILYVVFFSRERK